jgi:hypothetical protein
MFNGIAEHPQALAFFGKLLGAGESGRPSGMLGGVDVALGVRHEAEDKAGGVADAGNIVDAAVGVLTRVNQRDLLLGPERGAHVLAHRNELSFAVGDRQLNCPNAPSPHAFCAAGG